jgi:Zn-dependent peptidase ImmA (M78 family)
VAPFEQVDSLYRRHGDAFEPSDRQAIQEFLYLCETEALLYDLMGRRHIDFTHRPSGSFKKGHGEKAAAALRETLGYSDWTVGMDVFSDFRKLGIHVFRRRLGNSDISGLFIRHPTAGRCALVNFDEDIYRQRFSAAHETAHAILDTDENTSVSFFKGKYDEREVRANRFASCYLMPPPLLRNIPVKQGWDDEESLEWANRLKVSCNALGIALKEAGIVDETRSGQIRRLRVPKNAKVDPELQTDLTDSQRKRKLHLLELGLSDAYVTLCFDALQEGHISRGRLAEALLTDHVGLVELSSLYGRSLHGR